jgi:hypothetical protein
VERTISLVTEKIKHLVNRSAGSLDEYLADFLSDKGKAFLPSGVEIYDVHNFNGFSGHNYWFNGHLIGQIHLATLVTGNFAILKKWTDPNTNETQESYDYYDTEGKFVETSFVCGYSTVQYSSINMDPVSPFVNHFYNVLNAEYAMSGLGRLQTRQILTIEQFLRTLALKKTGLTAEDGVDDFAYLNIAREMYLTESDPILRWDERRRVYANLKEVRAQIIRTKRRVHRFNFFAYDLIIKLRDLKINFALIKRRPLSNMKGIMYRHTVGHLIWFYETVKNNLGLSIAMAIYGPFTYFFITQPMNPHAMNVVGKIRNSYYDVVESIEEVMDEKQEKVTALPVDTVTTKQSAPLIIDYKNKKISWHDRMAHFKALEVGFRKNMIDAVRFGRTEHMESQFSFSIVVEGLWHEIKRYENDLNWKLNNIESVDYRFKEYMQSELKLANKVKTYAWEKLSEFFLNHPYIVVDQDNEQKKKDFYNAKAFIIWQKITQDLFKSEKTEATHPKVVELANKYLKEKKQGSTIVENLKQNSLIFQQDNPFNAAELRKYMERHWEALYLQQMKKEEASSFALQTYTWSIRNALYAFQSIYSAKREDLQTLSHKFNMAMSDTDKVKPLQTINEYLESLLHLVTLEFTSIKKELVENIPHSDDHKLREDVIKSIISSVEKRDRLYSVKKRLAKRSAK